MANSPLRIRMESGASQSNEKMRNGSPATKQVKWFGFKPEFSTGFLAMVRLKNRGGFHDNPAWTNHKIERTGDFLIVIVIFCLPLQAAAT